MADARTDRIDFQATSDPALLASADRGESHLLSYGKLYELWERQQWATQDLDFSRDRERPVAGQQRARGAVVAALAADPQPAELAIVVNGLADELW